MLYRRLTKEELESMAEDFALFLASNSIDKNEWDQIKEENREKAEEMLDIFSDMVFEKALSSCKYLERITETEIHTYQFHPEQAHLISVRMANGAEGDFLNGNMSDLFMNLLKNKQLEVIQGTKKYEDKRELEMFKEVEKGAAFSKGDLYQSLLGIL